MPDTAGPAGFGWIATNKSLLPAICHVVQRSL